MAVAPVPFHVGIELALPELFASGRCCRVRAAGMPVPETAVNEAHRAEPAKHEIGSAGELAIVQAVSETTCVEGPAKHELGPRVPASDSRHHARTGRAVNHIRHCRFCAVGRTSDGRREVSRFGWSS